VTSFKDHFSDRAAGYASYRPTYKPELAAWLAGLVQRRELAWDVACGSGQLSTLLADHFDYVVATDASRDQIAQAKPHARVEYRVEPAESSTLASGTADLITVAQAAHWLDLEAFYKEVQRVARPGAAIALVAYHIAVIDKHVDTVIDGFYSGTLAGYWPPDRKHIESEYRDLAFPFEKIPTPRMEMRVTWGVDQMMGYIRTWSAVRALEKAKGPELTDRFAAELRRAWGTGARDVCWPVVIIAGRVGTAG
jgi:SAM-dependent methyltransferase